MSIVTEFFKQGELALAAYSRLATGISGKPYTDALEDVGMTPTQAASFASKWIVVDQYTDPVTGVSATVFQAVSDPDGLEVCKETA